MRISHLEQAYILCSKIVLPMNNTTIVGSQLRHTYITNLIYASVDPKTVQYLAGHENSNITMAIYAKVKYNTLAQLSAVVTTAFGQPA